MADRTQTVEADLRTLPRVHQDVADALGHAPRGAGVCEHTGGLGTRIGAGDHLEPYASASRRVVEDLDRADRRIAEVEAFRERLDRSQIVGSLSFDEEAPAGRCHAAELFGDQRSGAWSVDRIALQAAGDELSKGVGEVVGKRPVAGELPLDGGEDPAGLEGRRAGKRSEYRRSEAVDVGPMIAELVVFGQQLGCEEPRRPYPLGGIVSGADQPRQAEVHDLGHLRGGHEDVLGLQVAVNDPARMGVAERGGDVDEEADRPCPGRPRRRTESLRERHALDHLHDDVGRPGDGPIGRGLRALGEYGFAEVVHRDDGRMVEATQRPHLSGEASALDAGGVDDLDRDLPQDDTLAVAYVEEVAAAELLGQVDGAVAAAADLADDTVALVDGFTGAEHRISSSGGTGQSLECGTPSSGCP